MGVEKTVFISYRRTNIYMARAVYQDLAHKGYDVFLDFESLDTGSFEQIILNQIAARAHFVVILTPSALERCSEPQDWLRREIEHALKMKRNIVPLMFEGFDFAAVDKYLVGQLAALRQYNALNIPADYFEEAMGRLRGRFLSKPLEVILHPTPKADEAAVQRAKDKEAAQPVVQKEHLTAEQWNERAIRKFDEGDWQGVIADCNEAIRLNPNFIEPYINRAGAKINSRTYDGAFEDADKAIELGSNSPIAYNNRAAALEFLGDLDGAMADYKTGIQIDPKFTLIYLNRGRLRRTQGDLDGAIADYNEIICLNPKDADAYNERGNVRYIKGDLDGAIGDYTQAMYYKYPEPKWPYNNRGEAYFAQGKYDQALKDFKQANALEAGFNSALAGLAITNHALGNVAEAKRLWKLLVALDKRYLDAEWVKQELNWVDALADEARKVIGEMG